MVQSDVSFKSPRWEDSHQQVAFLVQRQVVGSGEAALTVGTLERLHARVLAEVSGELVGARKLPCAALPHALVGFLTCKMQERKKKTHDAISNRFLSTCQSFFLYAS